MGKVGRWLALWLIVTAIPASADEAPLSVTVLGSGGPGAVGRASSGYLVSVDGIPRILIDAGPGTFARLGETGLSPAKTDIILLTHLHADHAGELPGLVKARAVAVRAPITFTIFGPAGHAAKGEDAYFPATSRLVDQLFGKQGAFAYLSDLEVCLFHTGCAWTPVLWPSRAPLREDYEKHSILRQALAFLPLRLLSSSRENNPCREKDRARGIAL